MKQKQSMSVYTCIWIVAIVILIFSLFQNMGYSKVINYSGIVRGGAQLAVKEELNGEHDEQLILKLDNILHELQTGEGEYGLIRIDDDSYQKQLDDMQVTWHLMKDKINHLDQQQARDELYTLSQDFFTQADKMVATAQSVSDQHLFNSIAMFFIYLIITGGVFAFWYRYKQKQIQQVMYTDKLTGLYNGAAFEIEVQKHSESAMTESVLIYFDLDDFKYLNATYGYLFGNQMLIAIAKALREFVDGRGSCARNSNDCFFVFTHYHKNVIHDLKTCIIQSIKNEIEFDISDDITFTFGAYRIQKDISIQDMMENALLAHKNAKTRGKGNVVWYDQNLLDKIYQEGLIINQMHRALIDGEFQMFLQPKFKIPSLEIVGAEALVRWHMSDGKILYPDEFIPLFESNGFIYDLDFSILEQACQFIHEHQLYHFIIAVNFSRVTIHHKDFYERFKGIIERYQIPVKCLEIEITESAFNDLSSTILNMLMRLRNDGFVVSMDDFGSGYSSLNLLNTMSVDVLKIDRVFLLKQDEKKVKIIGLIIDIAKALNMKVICEGVETKQDLELLTRLKCPLGQGYYVSKAVSEEEFIEKFLNKMEEG